MALWGNDDNLVSSGIVTVNYGTLTITGSGTIGVDRAAVTNGATTLVNGNDVYDFVTGLGYTTNTGTVDTTGTVNANEFARFTDSNTLFSHIGTCFNAAVFIIISGLKSSIAFFIEVLSLTSPIV